MGSKFHKVEKDWWGEVYDKGKNMVVGGGGLKLCYTETTCKWVAGQPHPCKTDYPVAHSKAINLDAGNCGS